MMNLARSRDPHNERVTVGNFIDTAPDTLNRIEKAWVDEVDTNKRGRGTINRISRLQVFFKIGVLKNFTVLTEKHVCLSLFLTSTLLKTDSNTDAFL